MITKFPSILLLCVSTLSATAGPDWRSLPTNTTLSADDVTVLLRELYDQSGTLTDYLSYQQEELRTYSNRAHEGSPDLVVRFGSAGAGAAAPLTDIAADTNRPLAGMRVALDPGHIGGIWARDEQRLFYHRTSDWFVQEAAINLHVADLAAAQLRSLGAEVYLTKTNLEPVTTSRPADFRVEAEADVSLSVRTNFPPILMEASRLDALRKKQNHLFTKADLMARAEKINREFKPGVTICIHFNAVDTENDHDLVPANGLAVFVHGNYLAEELEQSEQRFALLRKLFEGSSVTEHEVAKCLTKALRRATDLPPAYHSRGGSMHPLDDTDYLYARNLAANRLYNGPVIFLEPYFMNNRETYERLQLGDYEGTQDINGTPRKSIFREYADAIVEGLLDYAKKFPAVE